LLGVYVDESLTWSCHIEYITAKASKRLYFLKVLKRVGLPNYNKGSVLGPLLFLLYTAELFDIIARAGLTGHCYANDMQVYISAPATSASTTVHKQTRGVVACVECIDA